MIYLSKVFKQYPTGENILTDINLKILRGEFIFIVGSSGVGKSTFLKLITKEEEVSSGTIVVDNINLQTMTRKDVPQLRRKIGMIFQDFKLLNNKTVSENVAFALEVIGTSRYEIRKKVPAALKVVGLLSKAENYPQELSGGEKQRVAIARAVVNTPPIILADEPTGNLDPLTSFGIMELLERINQMSGTTIIMATHNQNIVDRARKRVIILENGRIISDRREGAYTLGDRNG